MSLHLISRLTFPVKVLVNDLPLLEQLLDDDCARGSRDHGTIILVPINNTGFIVTVTMIYTNKLWDTPDPDPACGHTPRPFILVVFGGGGGGGGEFSLLIHDISTSVTLKHA